MDLPIYVTTEEPHDGKGARGLGELLLSWGAAIVLAVASMAATAEPSTKGEIWLEFCGQRLERIQVLVQEGDVIKSPFTATGANLNVERSIKAATGLLARDYSVLRPGVVKVYRGGECYGGAA